jgi:hypothetical protein
MENLMYFVINSSNRYTYKVYKVLVGKPEGKRPLGRPRRRWEDGIRMDLREIGVGGGELDSTGSGQGPVAGCCVR